MIKNAELVFKDSEGYGNEIELKDIIVISESSKEGVIFVETRVDGTYAFIKDGNKVDVFVDREYVVDNATLFEIASKLGLTGGV